MSAMKKLNRRFRGFHGLKIAQQIEIKKARHEAGFYICVNPRDPRLKFYRFLRFLGTGRVRATISGSSQPILSSRISRRAMSAAPRLPTLSIRGRLRPPPPEFNWRTRRDTMFTRTFGLPTFSLALLQSSAFMVISINSNRVAQDTCRQLEGNKKIRANQPNGRSRAGQWCL